MTISLERSFDVEEPTISIDKLIHPDLEQLRKRDGYLSSINHEVIKNKDGSITVVCPDLDLSDIR